MHTLGRNNLPAVKKIEFSTTVMSVFFNDGRVVGVPLNRYPLLARATRKQLLNYEVEEDGYGIHWPDIDEDLSIPGILRISDILHKKNASRHFHAAPKRPGGICPHAPKKKFAPPVKGHRLARRKAAG